MPFQKCSPIQLSLHDNFCDVFYETWVVEMLPLWYSTEKQHSYTLSRYITIYTNIYSFLLHRNDF